MTVRKKVLKKEEEKKNTSINDSSQKLSAITFLYYVTQPKKKVKI